MPIPVEIVGVINDNKTIASANKTGWWRVAVSNTATISDFPTFPGGVKLYGYGYLFVDLSSGSWLQHYYSHRGQNAKRQGWDGPLPTPGTSWVIEYNTANKPTPEDIGALPISGGQLTGGLGLHRGILFFPESAYKNKAEGLTGRMRLMLLIIAGNCTRVARQTAVFALISSLLILSIFRKVLPLPVVVRIIQQQLHFMAVLSRPLRFNRGTGQTLMRVTRLKVIILLLVRLIRKQKVTVVSSQKEVIHQQERLTRRRSLMHAICRGFV
ncbi:hypothetical protein [Citrobacter koseri]|uniref:hypothetical protein n=1 Tax=Citrobacter koseri TaxID=545 RepID=UPI0011C05719|nr:hypothetical protein [Citrobacter koseri]